MAIATKEKEGFGIIHRPDVKEMNHIRFLSFFYEAKQTIRILEFYKSRKKPKACLKFLNDEIYKDDKGNKVTRASELVAFFETFIPKSELDYTEDGEMIKKALEFIKEGKYNKVPKKSLKPMRESVERQIEFINRDWTDYRRRGCF